MTFWYYFGMSFPVSKLSKRITKLESEKRRLETEFEDMRRSHGNLMRKYEALVVEDERKIPLQEHVTMMDECRRWGLGIR